MSASSQSNPKPTTARPAADFCAAAKAALDSGVDPGMVSTYLGLAAQSPQASTMRLLASLLADAAKRAKDGQK